MKVSVRRWKVNILQKKNIKLTIEYDGTRYHGWQKQNGIITVQESIEKALEKILKHPTSLSGASRTDAGVHAIGQSANFYTDCSIPANKIPFALNTVLPEDIVIKEAHEVSTEFHARFSSKGKKYRYIINNSRIPSALNREREYFCPYKLNYELIRDMTEIIKGTHDFKGFMSAESIVRNTVRSIYTYDIHEINGKLIIEISGNGFLHNMVRILVGTLIDVGRMRISLQDIEKILENGNRKKAGKTVPPQGLYLVEVYY